MKIDFDEVMPWLAMTLAVLAFIGLGWMVHLIIKENKSCNRAGGVIFHGMCVRLPLDIIEVRE